jgi:hypothetical protein
LRRPPALARFLGIVNAGYATESWGEFFHASSGATAALAGLIFVGLSVNIGKVLELDRADGGSNLLTGRAIEALVAMVNVLVISIVALTPTIDRGVLAAVIIVVGLESAISPARVIVATSGRPDISKATLLRLVMAIAVTVTLLVAGITLAAHHGGGLFWLPASFVLAIAVAAINSWVLLVEVLR